MPKRGQKQPESSSSQLSQKHKVFFKASTAKDLVNLNTRIVVRLFHIRDQTDCGTLAQRAMFDGKGPR